VEEHLRIEQVSAVVKLVLIVMSIPP